MESCISSLSNLASASAIKFEEKPGETTQDVGALNIAGDIDFPSGVGLSIYGSLPETIKINVNNGNVASFAGSITDGSSSSVTGELVKMGLVILLLLK